MDDAPSSPHPQGSPQPERANGRSDEASLEHALDEDEKEQSFSAPSSPKLSCQPPPIVHGRPRVRSQSFDDILSSVNNEEDAPPSPSALQSPSRTLRLPFPQSNPDSGSESDTETSQHGIGVAYNHPLVVSSQPELAELAELAPQGAGKFDRLKGKVLQGVKLVQKLQPAQLSDRQAGSGSTAAQDTEDSDPQQRSQVTQKLLAVRQRFRNSPNLFRRMGVGGRSKTSPQPPPTPVDEGGGRREAREKCQSKFISL